MYSPVLTVMANGIVLEVSLIVCMVSSAFLFGLAWPHKQCKNLMFLQQANHHTMPLERTSF